MWWMAKRKIENWLAWIFSNIVAIPDAFYADVYPVPRAGLVGVCGMEKKAAT
jgi:nicotinamide riboside transporter PnuC